jgi:hypothetical protein
MLRVRQRFDVPPPIDARSTVKREFEKLRPRIKPNSEIAIAVGSRGITAIRAIVETVIEEIKALSAKPFIIPAMGSHGGATAEGQREILAEYGISEQTLNVPVRPAMDVQTLGTTTEGVEVVWSSEARRADGVIVINRIKPHTDFQSDSIGSGVLKIMVVGLGKRAGAAAYHVASTRFGYEQMLRSIAHVVLQRAPIVGGLGIVENQLHQTARIAALLPETMATGEAELFREAARLMPKLPVDDIDLLIVDRIGKNISGAGMDPNITGLHVDAQRQGRERPARAPAVGARPHAGNARQRHWHRTGGHHHHAARERAGHEKNIYQRADFIDAELRENSYSF